MITSQEFSAQLEKKSHSLSYQRYLLARARVFEMLEHAPIDTQASAYWTEELAGFLYMFDASPLIVELLRDHCYHLTGLRAYDYRDHHKHRTLPFAQKMEMLQGIDPTHGALFVPESPSLGGFGFKTEKGLCNIDTLKFYECIIGMERAGILSALRSKKEGGVVVEVGAGWGGLAYQFKTLLPDTTYVIVDLPGTILFSATYLSIMFPEAKILFHTGKKGSFGDASIGEYDFVFIPHYAWGDLETKTADLMINVASFQEMTSDQVRGYVTQAHRMNIPHIYSLNRDRSLHNVELTTVSAILAEKYQITPLSLLQLQYNEMPSAYRDSWDYKLRNTFTQLFRKPKDKRYRHIVATK